LGRQFWVMACHGVATSGSQQNYLQASQHSVTQIRSWHLRLHQPTSQFNKLHSEDRNILLGHVGRSFEEAATHKRGYWWPVT
jgi:hypothetical protein